MADLTDVSQYFRYLSEYKALICMSECHFCLRPNGVRRHLQDYHNHIPLSTRQKLCTYANGLSLSDPSEIQLPSNPISLIEGLKELEGVRCISCSAVELKDRKMKRHCEDAHGWSPEQGTLILYMLLILI